MARNDWLLRERKIAFDGFRQTLIWGETHDGNSHHLGGTAGNAGLFATARAVFRIAQAFVNGELVPRDLIGFGWDRPTPGSPATSMFSADAFGHTGSTGNLLWMDPATGGFCILFTTAERARAPWRLVHLSNAVVAAFV